MTENLPALYASKKRTLDQFLEMIRPIDSIATSIGAGQPRTLLNSLQEKNNIERIEIFTGLTAFPYPAFLNPKVYVTSGYYGPAERMINDAGGNLSYIPLPFNAFEKYADSIAPRIAMTTVSAMDEEGYFSLGTNCEAAFHLLQKAAQDPTRQVVLEVNPQMPRIRGFSELGDNKIHLSQIDAFVEADQSVLEVPPLSPNEVEKKIAQNVVELIETGDTLQFGIGGLPNEVASLLAESSKGDFGIHSEMVSDGFLTLMEAGKITNNKKSLNSGKSVFAFALGSQRLYEWLDERNGKNRGRAVAAPVSYVNDPSIIALHAHLVSINSGFMIDFSGQVCSEAIGEKQYSGVGGQLNFMEGAFFSPQGRSVLCLKSSVVMEGKRYSNIVESFPSGSIVSTPRHYVQWIVTEYGAVNLYGLTDEQRPQALIRIAHPDFRESLKEAACKRDRVNYKSRLCSSSK